jgi:6-pyruvoyltetrahydropterin/6-carboxytetrahydropterin synthase
MVYLTRRERFNAAHKLWVNDWSEEENLQTFGKCANNVKTLSNIIKKTITEKLDHSNLNLDVDFIPPSIQPTTENLVILIWNELEPLLKGCQLHSIKLCETENIYAEYFGN